MLLLLMIPVVKAADILYVDDNVDLGETVEVWLENQQPEMSVVHESSPSDAYRRLSDEEFDCIVSDYKMPGMNGIEFLDLVHEEHPTVPTILYTQQGSREIMEAAYKAGVDEFLEKGGGRDTFYRLADCIETVLTRRS